MEEAVTFDLLELGVGVWGRVGGAGWGFRGVETVGGGVGGRFGQ